MRKKKTTKTHWPLGRAFVILTALYAAVVYVFHSYLLTWTFGPYTGWGTALLILGVIIFVFSINTDRYRSKGLYSCVRYPHYAAWIILIIPGIVLCWGSVLGLSIPLIAYLVFGAFVRYQDEMLVKQFGLRYRNEMERTNAIFPRVKLPKFS